MRRVAICAALALAAVALAAAALWQALQPPQLLVPARRDAVLLDVVVVRPGLGREPHQSVRIRGARIESIGPAAAADVVAASEDAYRGAFVLPGLIDLHVHHPPRIAAGNAELWSLLFLAHGVTGVRDVGSLDGGIFDLRRRIREGQLPGPRISACGAMLDGDPASFPTNRKVHDAAEGRRAVEEMAARGADCIKVYNMLSPEALAAIRTAAHRAGLRLIGHKPHAVALEEAGLAEIQHLTGTALVDLEKIGLEDHRPEDWLGVDEARMDFVVRVSREQQIAHTPTLFNARMRRLLVDSAGSEADTGLRHLPGFWQAVWPTLWSRPFEPGSPAAYEHWRGQLREMTRRLHRGGVRVLAGTDTLMPYVAPGSSLHGELDELSRAGLTLEEVWGVATRVAGEVLGVPGLGTLEPGAPADLLVFRQDPTRDLRALATLEAVVADGRIYTRAALDADLRRFDAHFRGRLYDTVMGWVARTLQHRFAPPPKDRT